MHIMLLNTLPHMQPHTHMWKDTIELKIGGKYTKELQKGKEETNKGNKLWKEREKGESLIFVIEKL